MTTPKCSTCRDTGHRDPSSFDLDCTECNVAEQRVALNNFVDQAHRGTLFQADVYWAIHQRALAMAPKQERRPVHEENARHAIDAAILFGRNGTNKPPTDDHWLMQYWNMGAQFAMVPKQEALTDERAEFEASSPTMHIKRNKHGLYENLYVHHAWLAWQARAELNAPAASNGERAGMQAMQEEIRRLRAMLFPEKPDETTGWTIVPLKSIYSLLNLIDPPPVEANGKTMVFVNPHAAEVLTKISAEVRAMMAAKPSVDAQSGARGAA